MQTIKQFEDDVKTGVSESFPGDLPAFTDAAALGLSMDHDLAGKFEGLRRYYDDSALVLVSARQGRPIQGTSIATGIVSAVPPWRLPRTRCKLSGAAST